MSSILRRLVDISLTQNELLSMQLPSRSQVSHRQYYKLTRNSINQGRTTWAAPTGAQRCVRVDSSPWVRRSALTGAQLNATRPCCAAKSVNPFSTHFVHTFGNAWTIKRVSTTDSRNKQRK